MSEKRKEMKKQRMEQLKKETGVAGFGVIELMEDRNIMISRSFCN